MTPQEKLLVDELFDRLARMEASPRDATAERAIADGAARAPHALYALVQTVLVQDEALKQAQARLRVLSGEDSGATGGFLDTMRGALTGRGSVPSVRAGAASEPDRRWNSGGALSQGAQPAAANAAPNAAPAQGGSFLGTAAATAAGVIGGSMLFNALGGMFGGHHNSGSAFADTPKNSGSPWDNSNSAAGSDMSRDAGLNDIGNSGDNRSAGLLDSNDDDAGMSDDGDFGGDFGGDFDGGSDSA